VRLKVRIITFRFFRIVLLLLLCGPGLLQANTPSEPVYLSQTWFHRGPEVNIFTTPEGEPVAVDNRGRYLTSDEINRFSHRSVKLPMRSLQKIRGDYYLAREAGYRGNGIYQWFQVSDGDEFLAAQDVTELVGEKNQNLQVQTQGFNYDFDRVRGDSGLMVFPEGGLAVTCARGNTDSRMFRIDPFAATEPPQAFTKNDDVEMPLTKGGYRGARLGGFEVRAIGDPDRKGFWCVGSQDANLALVHATPGRKADGGRTLGLGKIVNIGDTSVEQFEAAVAGDGMLYLLIVRENPSIGGVDAERRLLRVKLDGMKVEETPLSLKRYIRDARLTLCGDLLIAYARDQIHVFDADTLRPRWSRTADELSGNSSLDYGINRICARADGSRLAVALATPYRRPDEPTLVHSLDPGGDARHRWQLRPGSVDAIRFTDDDGILLFSDDYTAKLGGSTPVAENEAAAIALADQKAETKPEKEKPAPTYAFVDKPLKERHKIWYAEPDPKQWMPLGNGTLGAMMFGGIEATRTVLDVDSMWLGDEQSQGTFSSLGSFSFALGHDPEEVTAYRRELDLRTGLYTVTYKYKGVTYTREAFCSYPRGLLAIRFTASQPGALSGELQLKSQFDAKFTKSKEGIRFAGQLPNKQDFHLKFACHMRLQSSGGQVLPAQGQDGADVTKARNKTLKHPYNSIAVQNCDSVTVYIAGDTNYVPDPAQHYLGDDPQPKIAEHLRHADKMTFDQMATESAEDVSRLFDRCTLDLATAQREDESLPTGERKNTYKRRLYHGETPDVGLERLAFDAVRYMMIACSRPGTLPANLQGVWNEGRGAAWTGDYHTDINIEMNYWFTLPANLAECHLPYFEYIESQIPPWREQTKRAYGESVPGWTVEYMNNIFGAGTYMIYVPGSAWLTWNYSQHFQFDQDLDFLEDRAYPVLKETARQWKHLLIERPDGQLTTPWTMSPEHPPKQFGIAQDRQMVYNLFTRYMAAAARLKQDAEFAAEARDLRSRIVPPRIGRWGQLQEWEIDRDSRYCGHRHMMHVFGAFPGRQINPYQTPQLTEAVATSLIARGPGFTGWSMAWRGSLYARMKMPERAYAALSGVLPRFHDNLIWESKQQIDAPCGFASGVCEMLLQSYMPLDDTDTRFEVELLPALPEAWPTGKVQGLRARGGFTVDQQWEDGKLTEAVIHNVSSPTDQCTIRYNGKTTTLTIPKGKSTTYAGN